MRLRRVTSGSASADAALVAAGLAVTLGAVAAGTSLVPSTRGASLPADARLAAPGLPRDLLVGAPAAGARAPAPPSGPAVRATAAAGAGSAVGPRPAAPRPAPAAPSAPRPAAPASAAPAPAAPAPAAPPGPPGEPAAPPAKAPSSSPTTPSDSADRPAGGTSSRLGGSSGAPDVGDGSDDKSKRKDDDAAEGRRDAAGRPDARDAHDGPGWSELAPRSTSPDAAVDPYTPGEPGHSEDAPGQADKG